MTTGTARAARWLEDGQLKLRDTPMIFMYHGVADVDEDPNQLCVSPAHKLRPPHAHHQRRPASLKRTTKAAKRTAIVSTIRRFKCSGADGAALLRWMLRIGPFAPCRLSTIH